MDYIHFNCFLKENCCRYNYKALGKAISNVRRCASVMEMDEALDEWDEEICEDYERREKLKIGNCDFAND